MSPAREGKLLAAAELRSARQQGRLSPRELLVVLPCGCDTRNALQVVGDTNVNPLREQAFHAFCDGAADFHHQPPTWLERSLSLRNKAFDYFQPSCSAENSLARLELPDSQHDVTWLQVHNTGSMRD